MDIEFELASTMESLCDDLLEQGEIKRIETDDTKVSITVNLDDKNITIYRYLKTDKVAVAVES